ncbi:MAG: hypothetical protein RXS42_08785 [Nitrososphaeria archaeon]
MSTNPIQIRRRTPLPVMAHAVYLYFSGPSLRRAARSLRNVIVRGHVSIWRWAQRLGPILGSARILGKCIAYSSMRPWWTWEGPQRGSGSPSSPTSMRCSTFHVSWRGNSIDAYLFIRRLVRRYGRVPIYTDGAGWCADACRWAGVERAVYDRPLRNLMERAVQYVKEGTEAFDDLFPVGGRRPASGRAFSSARITGYHPPHSCSCRTSCSRTGIWGGPRWCGGRRGCRGGWTCCARSSRSGRG